MASDATVVARGVACTAVVAGPSIDHHDWLLAHDSYLSSQTSCRRNNRLDGIGDCGASRSNHKPSMVWRQWSRKYDVGTSEVAGFLLFRNKSQANMLG